MNAELKQIHTEAKHKKEDTNPRKTEEFEETLAEAVYEGLSWVSNIVAPTLDLCIQGSTTVEIGLRRTRLNMDDCEFFEKGLEKVFGFGAKLIEHKILGILQSKLGVTREIEQSFKFSDEVRMTKKLYESKLCQS